MPTSTPFATYYAARVGRWRGPILFRVTSWRAFWQTPMAWGDRLRTLATVCLARLLGPPTMRTTVEYPWQGDVTRVQHTTRIVSWGVTVLRSRECFTLHEGSDRTFAVQGSLWLEPSFGRARDFGASTGEILADGARAHYHFDWLGQPLEQRTADLDGNLALLQDTAYSRACVVLERYSTAA